VFFAGATPTRLVASDLHTHRTTSARRPFFPFRMHQQANSGAAADFGPPDAKLFTRSWRGPKPLSLERWATLARGIRARSSRKLAQRLHHRAVVPWNGSRIGGFSLPRPARPLAPHFRSVYARATQEAQSFGCCSLMAKGRTIANGHSAQSSPNYSLHRTSSRALLCRKCATISRAARSR